MGTLGGIGELAREALGTQQAAKPASGGQAQRSRPAAELI